MLRIIWVFIDCDMIKINLLTLITMWACTAFNSLFEFHIARVLDSTLKAHKKHTKRSLFCVDVFVSVSKTLPFNVLGWNRNVVFWAVCTLLYLTHVLDVPLDYDEDISSYCFYYSSFFFNFFVLREENSSQTVHIKIILFMMPKAGGDGKKSLKGIFESGKTFSLTFLSVFSYHKKNFLLYHYSMNAYTEILSAFRARRFA